MLISGGDGNWSPDDSAPKIPLRGLWGADPSSVVAVGDTVLEGSKGNWSTSPFFGANGVWGTSATNVIVVGASSLGAGWIYHKRGQ